MPKTVKIAGNPEIDPTMPKIELKLAGKSYFLVFSFGALAVAQKGLRDAGVECNLLHALDLTSIDPIRLPLLFYATLITHQPKMTIEQATTLVTMKTLGPIYEAVINAYGASLAEPSPEDAKSDPNQPDA
jgi:hypothetical protein